MENGFKFFLKHTSKKESTLRK